MQLHEKCSRDPPFRAHGPDAWQFRHRLLGPGAGGMLGELSSGFDVTIRTTGLLITFGAVVLTGGLLFGRELLHSMGFVAAAFVVLAVAMFSRTRPAGGGSRA
jgi:hypothetical protein